MPVAISELTGQPVDTYSEAWRAECEARALLAMPSRDHRNRFLYGYTDGAGKKHRGVADIRGKAAADELRALAEQLFYARKQRAESPPPPPAPQRDLFAA